MNTKTINWKTLVQKYWGKKWGEKEVVYQFSNGRKFVDTGTNGGPYRQ